MLWTNERIGEWTSHHDTMAVTEQNTGNYAYAIKESVIRTTFVIDGMRQMRDEMQAEIDRLQTELDEAQSKMGGWG